MISHTFPFVSTAQPNFQRESYKVRCFTVLLPEDDPRHFILNKTHTCRFFRGPQVQALRPAGPAGGGAPGDRGIRTSPGAAGSRGFSGTLRAVCVAAAAVFPSFDSQIFCHTSSCRSPRGAPPPRRAVLESSCSVTTERSAF